MSETLFFLLFSVGVMAVMLIDLGVFKKDKGPQANEFTVGISFNGL